jgi:large subunit ribosomal protein L5
MNKLESYYKNIVRPDLLLKLPTNNVHSVPEIEKVILKISIKNANQNPLELNAALVALSLITGQKPKIMRSKKSIAEFNLRKYSVIGGKVTLRNNNMYYFLDTLITSVLPKFYEFKGISSKSFDGRGNLSIGMNNLIHFPEIEKFYFNFKKNIGMDITIVTTASNDKDAMNLLSAMQIPINKN